MEKSLYECIFTRKSFHLFRNTGDLTLTEDETESIYEAYKTFAPLYPEIRTLIRIVPEKSTTCRRGAEKCILLYSEKKDGYLQNIGYLGEMLDLWLVSQGIGTLWYGIGKSDMPEFDGLDYVIMIAIKKVNPDVFRKDMFKSKRKPIGESWVGENIKGVTDIVGYAPSACNTQPWKSVYDGDIKVYRVFPKKCGIMPVARVPFYNRIDIGIYICFMDLCLNNEGIKFERKVVSDVTDDKEDKLNAVYVLKKGEQK